MKKYIKSSTSVNKVVDWIGEHDQAFEDFKTYFSPDYDPYSVPGYEVIAWIYEHETLWEDFCNYFNIDPDWAEEAPGDQVFRMANGGKPKKPTKKEVYAFLKSEGGYSDYNQKVEDLMNEFYMTREEAEGYVWNFTSGLHKLNPKMY